MEIEDRDGVVVGSAEVKYEDTALDGWGLAVADTDELAGDQESLFRYGSHENAGGTQS